MLRASILASGAHLVLGAALLCSGFARTQQPGQLDPSQSSSPGPAPPPRPAQATPESTEERKTLRSVLSETNGPAIQFESHGLEYESVTHGGVTLMYAALPPRMKNYSVLQVTVTNGSPVSWTVKAEDFKFTRQDGTVVSP